MPPAARVRQATAGNSRKAGRGASLRSGAFAVALLILLQYALGMWVNLFATIPPSDQGKGLFGAFGAALARGPVSLTLHALIGTLLLLAAISFLLRAVLARSRAATLLGGIGALAIIAAWVNGALFVGNGADGPSFGMAMAAALALLCYVTVVFLRPSRQAPDR